VDHAVPNGFFLDGKKVSNLVADPVESMSAPRVLAEFPSERIPVGWSRASFHVRS